MLLTPPCRLTGKRVWPTSVSAQQLLPQRLKHLNGLVFFCEAGGLQLLAAMISRQFEECFKDSVSGHCCDFTTIPPACLRYPSKCYSSALQHVSLIFTSSTNVILLLRIISLRSEFVHIILAIFRCPRYSSGSSA